MRLAGERPARCQSAFPSWAFALVFLACLWPAFASAAPSLLCPTLNATVAHGGAVAIDVSACDGPFDAGMSGPIAPFALLAAPVAWRRRREPAVAFLIAWIVPCWLVFEATPTKLPHYVLPLYPAIAILTAMALPDGLAAAGGLTRRIAAGLLLLVPVAAPIALLAGAAVFGAPLDPWLFLTAAAAWTSTTRVSPWKH